MDYILYIFIFYLFLFLSQYIINIYLYIYIITIILFIITILNVDSLYFFFNHTAFRLDGLQYNISLSFSSVIVD